MPTSFAPIVADGASRVWLAGICIDALSESQLIDQVIASTAVGRGGWIATPNTSFIRRASADERLRSLLDGATLRVADGMPLLWASYLARTPRLERIPGSELIYSLAGAAAEHGLSIYLLGGGEGAAELAARNLCDGAPGLRVVGAEGPWVSEMPSPQEIQPVIDRLVAARPDIVFCGLGFPKQEWVIEAVREQLPATWFVGCGQAINFAAGFEKRAPRWMQRSGLEWLHRLLSEPRRLSKRYVRDLPFVLALLAVSLLSGRLLRRWTSDPQPYPREVVLPGAAPARGEGVAVLPGSERDRSATPELAEHVIRIA